MFYSLSDSSSSCIAGFFYCRCYCWPFSLLCVIVLCFLIDFLSSRPVKQIPNTICNHLSAPTEAKGSSSATVRVIYGEWGPRIIYVIIANDSGYCLLCVGLVRTHQFPFSIMLHSYIHTSLFPSFLCYFLPHHVIYLFAQLVPWHLASHHGVQIPLFILGTKGKSCSSVFSNLTRIVVACGFLWIRPLCGGERLWCESVVWFLLLFCPV